MRKGITPVVAVILLISITISAAGTLYIYVNSATTAVDNTDQFETQLNVNFESCWEDGTGYRYSIRNVNDAAFNSSKIDVYVDDIPANNYNFGREVVDTEETVQLFVDDVDRGDTVRIRLGEEDSSETCRQ